MTSTGRGKATTLQQRSAVLDWLEVPSNFRFITRGTPPGPAVVAGRKLKKSDAYKLLATFVNDKLGYSDPSLLWDKRVAKIRYESLLKTYRKTRERVQDQSEGKQVTLTEDELSQGKTIDTKLNEMCPYYQRWDRLYGELMSMKDGLYEDTANSVDLDATAEYSNDEEPFAEKDDEHVRLSLEDDEGEASRDIHAADASSSLPVTASRAHFASTPQRAPSRSSATAAARVAAEKRRAESIQAASKASRVDETAAFKTRELELATQRLELDRAMAHEELELKKQIMIEEREQKKQSAKDALRKDVILALIQQGKSPDEIKEFLAMLGCE